jgi:hypothetical protein
MVFYAHQGGWDEALYVLVPLVAMFAILIAAKKRADKLAKSANHTAVSNSDTTETAGTPGPQR